MGQYHKIKCPVCGTSLETSEPMERCSVCKAYIADKLHLQGGGTGITTATARGQNLNPWLP